MSLTEDYADDSSDDGAVRPESEIQPVNGQSDGVNKGGEEVEKTTPANVVVANLNASNLEQHNKNNMEVDGTDESKNNRSDCDSETKTQVGAGIFFGLSGLVMGGPILGVLTGTGAAIVASRDKGPAGDLARATGDFTLLAGSKVGEVAKEANEKHGILDKVKNFIIETWSRFQQFDEEHKISEKSKETMSDITQKTVEFENRHHVLENVLEGIHKGVNFLLVKLKDATGGENGVGNGRS